MKSKIAATAAALHSVLTVLILAGAIHLSAQTLAGIDLAVVSVGAAVAAWRDPRVPFGPSEGE